jgi:hypothetical protein
MRLRPRRLACAGSRVPAGLVHPGSSTECNEGTIFTASRVRLVLRDANFFRQNS